MEYRWYAIQTTAGHENKVRSLIQKRIEDDPRPAEEKLIRQALVPTQDVIEIKNGKKVTVERKLFPGYVLVDMQMGQEALHVVNSIQGVIKFVGSGKLPQPLRQDEVQPPAGRGRGGGRHGREGRDPVPHRPGGRDHRGTVLRLLRHRGRGAVREGQGEGVGEPVRPADERGDGLPAAEGCDSTTPCRCFAVHPATARG